MGALPSLAPGLRTRHAGCGAQNRLTQQPQEDLSLLPSWAASLWPSHLSWACCHVLTGVPPSAWCQSDPIILHLGLKLWMLKPGVHLPDLQFKTLHTLAMLLLSSHFLTTPILHSPVTGPLASLKNPISLSA